MKKSVCLFPLLFFLLQQGLFSSEKVTQVEIILDASRSMRNRIGNERKIQMAKKALLGMMEDLRERKDIRKGLRIFGHRSKLCRNTVLEAGINTGNEKNIRDIVRRVKAVGNTPIAYSLIKASEDFDINQKGEKIILLITDGNETCGDNPCLVAEKLKMKGVISRIHIVGLGLSSDNLDKLQCIVKPFGGVVISVDEPEKLRENLLSLVGKESQSGHVRERTESKNLVVTGMDKNGKKLFLNVDVRQGDKKIVSQRGEIVSFSLEPGKYSLLVKSDEMKGEYTLDEIEVIRGKLTRKNLDFSKSLLIIRVRDILQNHVDTEIEISREDTGEIVKKIERVEVTVDNIRLSPGLYNIIVRDMETGYTARLRNIRINPGTNIRKLIFRRGRVEVSGKSKSGTVKYTAVYIYKAGTGSLIKKSTGTRNHMFILLPGRYDIRIKDWYGRGERLLKNVEIVDGKTVVKTAVID